MVNTSEREKDVYKPVSTSAQPNSDEVPQFSMEREQGKDNCQKALRDHFDDYCSTTGIHGFSYLGQHRTITENIFWIILLIFSLAGSIYMINEIYQKYLDSPTAVTIASIRKDISQIPFPAVTICAANEINLDGFGYEQLKKKAESDTLTEPEEIKLYNYASWICDKMDEVKPGQNFSEDIYDFMEQFSTISVSSTKSEIPVVPITSDMGLCYTFNTLDHSDIFRENIKRHGDYLKVPRKSNWDHEAGIYVDNTKRPYPIRVTKAGPSNSIGFSIEQVNNSKGVKCLPALDAYMVILHLPGSVPMEDSHFIIVPKKAHTMIAVEPSMIVTSSAVKSYNPLKRQCFFPSEKPLTYHKIYTKRNCRLECVTKILLRKCNCVEFYMPRTNNTEICGPAHKDCVVAVEEWVEKQETDEHYSDDEEESRFEDMSKYKNEEECHCMSLCTDISYEASIVPLPLNDSEIESNVTTVFVYFKGRNVYTLERNELYGISDFISNFGGLVGLFTGFSIMSGFEILYFLSLRIWGNLQIYRRWAAPAQS